MRAHMAFMTIEIYVKEFASVFSVLALNFQGIGISSSVSTKLYSRAVVAFSLDNGL